MLILRYWRRELVHPLVRLDAGSCHIDMIASICARRFIDTRCAKSSPMESFLRQNRLCQTVQTGRLPLFVICEDSEDPDRVSD